MIEARKVANKIEDAHKRAMAYFENIIPFLRRNPLSY